MSTCRSCDAPITWAITTKGRRMPIDAEPVADGNIILDTSTTPPTAHVVGTATDLFDNTRYVSHYVTCPDAEQWRTRDPAR